MFEEMEMMSQSPSPEKDSDDDSGKLEIVIRTRKKKRLDSVKPTEKEQKIIQSVENEIEKNLEEKAAKTKLNAVNVKNIIKHVVTNKHVLALVRKVENTSKCSDEPEHVFEPKLTRSKAKQLSTEPPVPWMDPKVVPKVLKKKQKQERPDQNIVDVQSENAPFSSGPSPVTSTILTITYPAAVGTQTTWSEDGLFKIPMPKPKADVENESPNKMRKKACVADNPQAKEDNEPPTSDINANLEATQLDQETDTEETASDSVLSNTGTELGEATPDPETDLDDMEYDEDWMDFLKKITLPLDEITKATEDEEQDPEYNILADEEVEKVDKEELRMDKAVKISKKELNALIAELLLDCANSDSLSTNNAKIANETYSAELETTQTEASQMDDTTPEIRREAIYVTDGQILIVEQQMRQHVQLLTQNFLLTYRHPEFHNYSFKFKEYLWNLNMLRGTKERSAFSAANLSNAINLVGNWEARLAKNDDEFRKMIRHIEKTTDEAWQYKLRGSTYILTFPTPILETIAYSEVFLYTSLLPKIPYKSPRLYAKNVVTYTNSEDNLIALGLEQFYPIAAQSNKNLTSKGEAQLKVVCAYIQEYMLPYKDVVKLYNHVKQSKSNKCGENPIKYYFRYKKAPNVVHFVMPLEQLQLVPPCKRPPNELPIQLRQFLYPNINFGTSIPILTTTLLPSATVSLTPTVCLQTSPSGHVISFVSKQNQILPKIKRHNFRKRKRRRIYEISNSDENRFSCDLRPVIKNVDIITKFVQILCKPSDTRKLLKLYIGDSSPKESAMDPKCDNVASLKLNESTTHQTPDDTQTQDKDTSLSALPSMPQLSTPMKKPDSDLIIRCSTPLQNTQAPPLNFSSISNLPQEYASSEAGFSDNTNTARVVTMSNFSKEEGSNKRENHNRKNDTLTEKENSEDHQNLSATHSAVKQPIRKEPSGAEKKKTKIRREFLGNLSIATPEDPEVDRKKCETFALKYYNKMRETMVMEDYHQMVQILNDHEEGNGVDLYRKVEPILRPRYADLADEFLLFLKDKEAVELNQLIPWIRVNNRLKFLRKLEIYFKDQPAQLKKIYKSLSELSQTMDGSMEKIKATMLPMFKGNAILTDMFLQDCIFEKPPPSLLEGPYETIDISKEISKDEEPYETITIPDVEDSFGGQTCICTCHKIEDPEYISRLKHCNRCGIKFVNGKVFIQTGKCLRPANFSFLTNPDMDHSIRLTGKSCLTSSNVKRRCETSPFKQSSSSPTKENCDEESDYDGDLKKKSRKRPQKKYKKQSDKTTGKDSPKGKMKRSPRNASSPLPKDSNKPSRKRKYSMKKSDKKKCDDKEEVGEKTDYKPGNSQGQQKRFVEESSDLEDSIHIGEALSDVKGTSPEQNTAESESEFCEESSQDNCESDSNSSIASDNMQCLSDGNSEEGGSWKRVEDKIILEAFRKENDKEDAFNSIASQLKNRSISQIRKRFDTLINLLMETIGSSSS